MIPISFHQVKNPRVLRTAVSQSIGARFSSSLPSTQAPRFGGRSYFGGSFIAGCLTTFCYCTDFMGWRTDDDRVKDNVTRFGLVKAHLDLEMLQRKIDALKVKQYERGQKNNNVEGEHA